MSSPTFPATRLRRLRRTPWVRDLVREVRLAPADLILPIFLVDGAGVVESAPDMPGVARYSADTAVERAREAEDAGIGCVLLLPCLRPEQKSDDGAQAWNADGLLARSVQAMKAARPSLGIMADVALDLYTAHGHDGLLVQGDVDNDSTVAALVRQSLFQAALGVDVLAPSDMMDGRIGAIRTALETAGHSQMIIAAHASKYASALYGPYRGAVGSKSSLGKRDKRSYQQDPANAQEALREVELDLAEGADLIIAKPGTFYLDVLYRVKQRFGAPVLGFHVSGEYAMIKAAAERGFIDGDAVMLEALVGFKRAGASGIITYAALDAARMIG
jgi:porphobilinogen synthase